VIAVVLKVIFEGLERIEWEFLRDSYQFPVFKALFPLFELFVCGKIEINYHKLPKT
jgi:hypothetical protein